MRHHLLQRSTPSLGVKLGVGLLSHGKDKRVEAQPENDQPDHSELQTFLVELTRK